MKKVKIIADFLFLYCNVLVVFLLPLNGNLLLILDDSLDYNLLPIPFLLFVLSGVLTSSFSFKSALKSWCFKGFSALFLFYVCSGFILSDWEISLKAIEIKLSFLILPLLVFANETFYKKYLKHLIVTLIIGVVLALLVLDYNAYSLYNMTGFVSFYVDYIKVVHPTYIGAVIVVVVISVLEYFFTSKFNWFKLIFLSFLVWFLFFHLFLILSKAVVIIATFVLIFMIFLNVKNELKKVLILILTITIPVVFLLFQKQVQTLIVTTVKYRFSDLSDLNNEGGSTSFRLKMLKSFPEIIENKWLIGVGPGNESTALQTYYQKNNWLIALDSNFNTHNQFLQTWLSLGVFGFVVFVLIMTVPFFIKIKPSSKLIVFSFVFLFCTEAMLERQFGILFFTLTYCFILLNVGVKKVPKQ